MISSKFSILLDQILEDKYITASELAGSLKITEKTVRKYVALLSDELQNHGARIVGKQKLGFILEIYNKEKYTLFLNSRLRNNDNITLPNDADERVPYILAFLLDCDRYVKKEEICDTLFISNNTLTADLKRIEILLEDYSLTIDRKPRHGLMIIGEELKKRTALVSVINQLVYQKKIDYSEAERKFIGETIFLNLNEYNITIPEDSFRELIKFICINIYRIKRDFVIDFQRKSLDLVIDDEIKLLAKEITQRLEVKFNVIFGKDEVNYLTALIVTKMSSESLKRYVKVNDESITQRVNENVSIIVKEIYREFNIDFQYNFDLKINLMRHFLPMGLRLRYGIPLHNPMTERIKKEYALAYTIATSACRFVAKKIPDGEIAFVALIFALALEGNKRDIIKKNLIFVCSTGKATSQFLVHQYRKNFGDYLGSTYECTVNELQHFDFIGKKIDFVFTTVPIMQQLPVPIFEINPFMDKDEIESYSNFFKKESSPTLLDYYKQDLFFTNLQGNSKEEVIKELINKCNKRMKLPSGFYQSILERESNGSTAFGNLIAIPHPNKAIEQESFVAVGILKEPIRWESHSVQVIFLISISAQEDNNVQQFYETTTSFLFNRQKVKELIAKPTFNLLMDLLQK